MKRLIDKRNRKDRRKRKVRKSMQGTADRPRLSVFKSARHMFLQAIDDESGKTLASISTMQKDMKGLTPTVENAGKIGEAFGAILKKQKISTVVFDRNGNLYHGVVKAIADGARKSGITV